MKDTRNPTTASGKTSHSSVTFSGQAVAKTIVDGATRGLDRICSESLRRPLKFWITGHVADETKLWYIINGYVYRKFPTLSYHTQVAWRDGDATAAIHDEDVVRPPRAMTKYTAAVQYNILTEDECAGVNPQVGLRPSARYYGTTIIWGSHGVNKFASKHLRTELDPRDLLLPAW